MAQSFNFNGVNLVIPGAYVQTTVLNPQSGIAANGIIALVGEATSGLSYKDIPSKDFGEAVFTPSEFSKMQSLYGSGDLVDAFANIVQPYKEAGLIGGPTAIYVLKTNATGASPASLKLQGNTDEDIVQFFARNIGEYGNQIKIKMTAGSMVKGMYPLEFVFNLDQRQDSASITATPPLTFASTDVSVTYKLTVQNNTLSIYEASALVTSFDLTKIKNLQTLKADIEAYKAANVSSLTELTVSIDSTYQFEKLVDGSVKLFDDGEYSTASTDDKHITNYGYQLAQINSEIVAQVPTYISPTAPLHWENVAASDSNGKFYQLKDGATGITTQQDFKDALAKIEKLRINFVVPLFSVDSGETDPISGDPYYTIAQIARDTIAHVEKCSKIKSNRNRQAFLSRWTMTGEDYEDIKAFVANSSIVINSPFQYRTSVAFQQIDTVDGNGASARFDPWMLAAITAAAQAVGGYRPPFNKALNITGFYDPTGFDGSDEAYEDSLYSGLYSVRLADNGFDHILVSDQTAYMNPDNNFVYNSIQAVYDADIVAMTLQQRMQTFVGQSTADVTAGIALNYLKTVLSELLGNKWISASSDAPTGYKNAKVSLAAPVMNVSVEVKASTGIYFIPINLSLSAVTSSAQ